MAEAFSGMIDVLLGYDTDLHFENGDLMTTTGVDYIEREIYKLLITQPGDWKASPTLGCSPNRYTGEQNTRETAQRLKATIESGIRETVYPATSEIRVIPTDYRSVLIFIDVYVRNREVVTIPFEFEYSTGFRKLNRSDERVTKPRSTKKYAINDISTMTKPNRYWSRIRDDSLNI